MSRSIATRAFRLPVSRITARAAPIYQTSQRGMASQKINSGVLSDITAREKDITGEVGAVKGGPTAQAQKHANERISPEAVSDITEGERRVTGEDGPVAGGPAAMAQSIVTDAAQSSQNSNNHTPSGVLDSETISHITAAEKEITGSSEPAKGGPTAMAQKHTGEPITSESLHDITEGEKKITGGKRVKGGPTSTAQSELGKSRNA
ncbi:hypothetical protein F4808DRAFT_463586 [Astrocystis sublimbata]|nr:hypothetical protein F4808DRAFT_463586 [Astrocystis sublimbata]